MAPDHAPEDLKTKESYSRALIKACIALERERPDLIQEIRGPFPHYWAYIEAVGKLYSRMADRKEHDLEGFDECGFCVQLFRLDPSQAWAPLQQILAGSTDQERELITQLIKVNPEKYFLRRVMSPLEAFNHAQAHHDPIRLPDAAVPEILGKELGVVSKVEKDATLYIDDAYIRGKRYAVAGVVKTNRGDFLLDRGTRWLIHMSPLDGRYAYVSKEDGVYVGKAPVLLPGTKVDQHSIHRNLAIIREVEIKELDRLSDIADARLRKIASDAEHNVKLLTGRDLMAEQAEFDLTEEITGTVRISDADIEAVSGNQDRAEQQHEDEVDPAEIAGLFATQKGQAEE